MVNIFELDLKPWVGGIIIKEAAPGKWKIMTQKRYVKPEYRASYDPINHHRDEIVLGLLSNPGEDVITCLLREIHEECGMSPDWKPLRILGVADEVLRDDNRQVLALTSEEDYLQAQEIFWGSDPPDHNPLNHDKVLKVWTNGRGDKTIRFQPSRLPLDADPSYRPLCVVHNIGQPQHWLGPIFVVVVGPDFEPNYDDADGEAGPCRWWWPHQLKETMDEAPDLFMGPAIPALELLCEKLVAGHGQFM